MQSPERVSQQPAKESETSRLRKWWEIVSALAISYFNRITSPEFFVEHDPIEYLFFKKRRLNALAQLGGCIVDARCDYVQIVIQGKYGNEEHKYPLELLDETGSRSLETQVSDLVMKVDEICPILVSYRLSGKIGCQQFFIPGRYDFLDELNN